MTCAENVLTLTPECFHHHVFLLPLHSSLISAFSLYSVTSAFYSSPFHRPFSLLSLLTPFLCLLGVLFCSVFSNFPYLLCYLCFFSNFSVFPCVLCLSAFSLYSVFSPIFLFPQTLPCVLKRFSLTTSRKTATTCVENVLTLTPECFHRHVFLLPLHSSLISAFSLLLCYVRYLCYVAFYSPHFIVPFLYLL